MSIINDKKTRKNEQIRVREVRLIDAQGEQVGIVAIDEALRLASDEGLDLVEISPNVEPPVCRIMDYGKFLFEKNKRDNVARKNQRKIRVKELKFRPGTEEGDYQVKLRNLLAFLEEGDKVKITVRFRGREVAYREQGMKLLARIQQDVDSAAQVEQTAKMEGRQMMMVLSSKKRK
ncbi:MAG: translation initiation factor [Gammaproteobacteria bacterium]|jgi:translation initiation factor IF-3|nr:translation initiation factor [Gammaproteobacteria bacterium]